MAVEPGSSLKFCKFAEIALKAMVFFAIEAAYSARLALFAASALFALAIVGSAVFLSWMRRASA